MSRDFDALLEEALNALEGGESVDAVLARYPEQAHALAPLLKAAARCREALAFAEPPSPGALAAGRQRLLREAARRPAAPRGRPPLSLPIRPRPEGPSAQGLRPSLRPGLALAMAALLLIILVGGGATMAAADSLPGDPLYPVKLASQQARLALTFDPGVRIELASHFAEERRQEARIVAALGRQVEVHFQGVLEAFNGESWTVGGLTVVLDGETKVKGAPAVGATVAVLAWSPGDGTLRARHLRVLSPLAPGATSTSSPTHQPTHTPRPTHTREPAATPTPRATASPAGPAHEPTHGPWMTPEPEETHGPRKTLGPEETHEPGPTHTYEVRPTEPAHTSQGPGPTREPQMTPGPRPTHGPESTRSPGATNPPTPAPEPTEAPTQPPHGPMMTPGPHHTPRH